MSHELRLDVCVNDRLAQILSHAFDITAYHLPVCRMLSVNSSNLKLLLSTSGIMHLVLGLFRVYLLTRIFEARKSGSGANAVSERSAEDTLQNFSLDFDTVWPEPSTLAAAVSVKIGFCQGCVLR